MGRYPVEEVYLQNFRGQTKIRRRASEEQTAEDWLHASLTKWVGIYLSETSRYLRMVGRSRERLTAKVV